MNLVKAGSITINEKIKLTNLTSLAIHRATKPVNRIENSAATRSRIGQKKSLIIRARIDFGLPV